MVPVVVNRVMHERTIIPHHHVALGVMVAVAEFRPRRVPEKNTQQGGAFPWLEIFQTRRHAGVDVQALAPGLPMGTHDRVNGAVGALEVVFDDDGLGELVAAVWAKS